MSRANVIAGGKLTAMRILEHRIPPPIVAVIIGAAMWAVSRITPAIPIEGRLRFALAAAFAGFGFCVTAMAMIAFRRARTTINPLSVEQASSIVMKGVYRRTRNPMYVGLISLSWVGRYIWPLPGRSLVRCCSFSSPRGFKLFPKNGC